MAVWASLMVKMGWETPFTRLLNEDGFPLPSWPPPSPSSSSSVLVTWRFGSGGWVCLIACGFIHNYSRYLKPRIKYADGADWLWTASLRVYNEVSPCVCFFFYPSLLLYPDRLWLWLFFLSFAVSTWFCFKLCKTRATQLTRVYGSGVRRRNFPAWARVHVVMYPTSPQGWGRAVHWHGTALLIGGFSAAKGRCFCCWWCWCWPPAAARPCSPAAARRQRREAPVTPPVIDRKTQHIWSPSTPTLTWGFYAVKSSPPRTHTRTRPPPRSPSSCFPPADGIYKDTNTISVIEALGARKCVSELQTPICLDDKPEMKWQSNMFSNPRLSFFKNIESVLI